MFNSCVMEGLCKEVLKDTKRYIKQTVEIKPENDEEADVISKMLAQLESIKGIMEEELAKARKFDANKPYIPDKKIVDIIRGFGYNI